MVNPAFKNSFHEAHLIIGLPVVISWVSAAWSRGLQSIRISPDERDCAESTGLRGLIKPDTGHKKIIIWWKQRRKTDKFTNLMLMVFGGQDLEAFLNCGLHVLCLAEDVQSWQLISALVAATLTQDVL